MCGIGNVVIHSRQSMARVCDLRLNRSPGTRMLHKLKQHKVGASSAVWTRAEDDEISRALKA